jgi:small subunit ribosomal protein S2
MFVGTKIQAKALVEAEAKRGSQPFVTHRWLGGMLTNFSTIKKSIKHYKNLEKMSTDGTYEKISKKERLMIDREKAKLHQVLSGVVDMKRLPGMLFIVDIKKEHIAVAEASKLNIPIFAMVDTNSDPRPIDYVIPSNDDATKSIDKVLSYLTAAIAEGLAEKKASKERKTVDKPKQEKVETVVEEKTTEKTKE